MKKLSTICFVAGITSLVLLVGCYRQEVQVFTVDVPQLRSEACGKIVTDRLLQVEGVRSASLDIENLKIHVEYLSTKIAKKNIEFMIAGTGFDANDRKASADARNRLPEGCR